MFWSKSVSHARFKEHCNHDGNNESEPNYERLIECKKIILLTEVGQIVGPSLTVDVTVEKQLGWEMV